MLVHILDMSGSEGRDPYEDFVKINAELYSYDQTLAKVPQVVVANKMDIFGAEENLKTFLKKTKGQFKVFPVSAINAQGVEEMLDEVYSVLETLPPLEPLKFEQFEYDVPDEDTFEIERDEDGAYVVIGPLVDLLIRNVVLDDMDSLAYMQKTLKTKGVFKALKDMGVNEGDTVVIGEIEFDYVE